MRTVVKYQLYRSTKSVPVPPFEKTESNLGRKQAWGLF